MGKHEVLFLGSGEVIRLCHESENKEVFAVGALRAAEFILGKSKGFYDMTSILGSFHAVTSVSSESDVVLVTLPSVTFDDFLALLGKLKRLHINLDMISQNYNADGTAAVSFTLGEAEKAREWSTRAASPPMCSLCSAKRAPRSTPSPHRKQRFPVA